jgi:hypothetical protein
VDKVYQLKNLRAAGEKVKANRGSGDIDGQSLGEFEQGLEEHLQRRHRYIKAFRRYGLDRKYGARLVTYADDLVVLCRQGAHEALAKTRGWLGSIGLAPPIRRPPSYRRSVAP